MINLDMLRLSMQGDDLIKDKYVFLSLIIRHEHT